MPKELLNPEATFCNTMSEISVGRMHQYAQLLTQLVAAWCASLLTNVTQYSSLKNRNLISLASPAVYSTVTAIVSTDLQWIILTYMFSIICGMKFTLRWHICRARSMKNCSVSLKVDRLVRWKYFGATGRSGLLKPLFVFFVLIVYLWVHIPNFNPLLFTSHVKKNVWCLEKY